MALLFTAAYWLLLFALAIGAIRLLWSHGGTQRLVGAVLLITFCTLVITTIFRPEIRDWRLNSGTTAITPPRAMVFRYASPQIDSIAALFVTTGLFDVFVAAPGSGWPDTGEQIIVDKSKDCQRGADLELNVAAKCIHRQRAVGLPSCRILIDLNGPPPSASELAQEARIAVMMDGDQAGPFFGRREWIRLP